MYKGHKLLIKDKTCPCGRDGKCRYNIEYWKVNRKSIFKILRNK